MKPCNSRRQPGCLSLRLFSDAEIATCRGVFRWRALRRVWINYVFVEYHIFSEVLEVSAPSDFQLQMRTPQRRPLLHVPVCFMADMIAKATYRKRMQCVDVTGGGGAYSIFMNVHICLGMSPFNSCTGRHCERRNRQGFISDSCNVNKVVMVNRKSVGWSRGGGGGQGHGRCWTRLRWWWWWGWCHHLSADRKWS